MILPFTPFHFGPGLLVKSVSSRHFSWTAFVITQVVIDCETLYYLLQHVYPIHRTLHTFLGATIAGLFTSIILLMFKKFFKRMAPEINNGLEKQKPTLRSETSTGGILIGGIVGGISHPFLDGIMHPDICPFAPWTNANPLLNWIGLGPLHFLCLLSGIVGVIILGILFGSERVAG